MNRVLLVIALVVAGSAPVFADSGKPHSKTHSNTQAQYEGPRSKTLANALGGFNRGDPNDPYWDPCLSYQRNWGPGACGGN
jgi:hypothetical protein